MLQRSYSRPAVTDISQATLSVPTTRPIGGSSVGINAFWNRLVANELPDADLGHIQGRDPSLFLVA